MLEWQSQWVNGFGFFDHFLIDNFTFDKLLIYCLYFVVNFLFSHLRTRQSSQLSLETVDEMCEESELVRQVSINREWVCYV